MSLLPPPPQDVLSCLGTQDAGAGRRCLVVRDVDMVDLYGRLLFPPGQHLSFASSIPLVGSPLGPRFSGYATTPSEAAVKRECCRGRWWRGIEVTGRSRWMKERLLNVTVTPLNFLQLTHTALSGVSVRGQGSIGVESVKIAATNECTTVCLFGSVRSVEFVIP